jgi:hypothetical protein
MAPLTWDQVGERLYETGVDRGVLYLPDNAGEYNEGHAWNGLTTVNETPTGAGTTALFADNHKYLNLVATEEFGATVDAYTYPDAFAQCDGTEEAEPGVHIGQQRRRLFGLAYRTRLGNDTDGSDHGYKLHLVYGAQAAPSSKSYGTINDTPAAITFSWALTTNPVNVSGGRRPTSLVVVDSTKVDAGVLAQLEAILYGTDTDDPRLPLPDEIITLFGTGETNVDMARPANQPTFDAATGVVTLPAVAGVQWRVNGVNVPSGARPAIASGATATVEAVALTGNNIQGDDEWTFERS